MPGVSSLKAAVEKVVSSSTAKVRGLWTGMRRQLEIWPAVTLSHVQRLSRSGKAGENKDGQRVVTTRLPSYLNDVFVEGMFLFIVGLTR